MADTVKFESKDAVAVITLNRWDEARNAVDAATARALADALRRFDADESFSVAVVTGARRTFCAGADLKALTDPSRMLRLEDHGDCPMAFSRLLPSKPASAVVAGHA